MSRYVHPVMVLVVAVAAGCSLAPEYTRPSAPVPAAWPAGTVRPIMSPAESPTAGELPWREFVADEKLRRTIESALHNNRDLRLAALNVDRARAMYGIQRGALLPSLQAAGGLTRQHLPADLSNSRSEVTTERYDVNLGVSAWEIDFFGRIRSLRDLALEEFLATQQAHRSAQILLVSSVAQAYLTLAADREARNLAEATLKAMEDSYRLIRKRHDLGLASAWDLSLAQSQVDAARGDALRYEQMTAQDENALHLLAGSPVPQTLLPNDLGAIRPPREVSAGLSSEILLRRPDVLAAEHRLKGSHASIGAARAAFFPRISLTATAGTASAELAGLFKSASGTWSFTPQIVLPIFDARTWSAYDATKVEREISLTQYEKTIQTAFRETADALAAGNAMNERISAQESLVAAMADTYRLAVARYDRGIDGYLAVLDAQRALYAARQGLNALRLALLSNRVTLYRVLGGGV